MYEEQALAGWFIVGGVVGAWLLRPDWFQLAEDDPQELMSIPEGFSFGGPWSAKLWQALCAAKGNERIRLWPRVRRAA